MDEMEVIHRGECNTVPVRPVITAGSFGRGAGSSRSPFWNASLNPPNIFTQLIIKYTLICQADDKSS